MSFNVLIQKQYFQKYVIVYSICCSWILFFFIYSDWFKINLWVAYYIPLIILAIDTLIIILHIRRTRCILQNGLTIKARIIHSANDFGNGTLRVRCTPLQQNIDVAFVFEEVFTIPFLSQAVESVYREGKLYSEIEYVTVVVDENNYNNYEIMYCDLLTDECRKSKYTIIVASVILVLMCMLIPRYVPSIR